METLKRINFDSEIKLLYPNAIEDLFDLKNEEGLLSDYALKNIISLTALAEIYNPNSEEVTNKTQKAILFKNNLHVIAFRSYIFKILEHIPEHYQKDFESLKSLPRERFFYNQELLAFNYEFVLDTIFFERLWELGAYLIRKFSKNIFENISKTKLTQLYKSTESKSFTKQIYQTIVDQKIDFNEGELRLLFDVFRQNKKPDYIDFTTGFKFGHQEYTSGVGNVGIDRSVKLNIENIIDSTIERNNNINYGHNR